MAFETPDRLPPVTTPLRRNAAWLLLVAAGFFLAVAWVAASPVGASPDEPAHIAYAWGTATGQTIVNEKLVTNKRQHTGTLVELPQKLLQYPAPSCYWRHQEKPVNRCSRIPADNLHLVTQTSNMTRYPPLFYAVEGAELRTATALDLSGSRVLYGARLSAAVLSLLTAGFGVFLLARRFPAQVVALATLLALPPMAWFMTASVNPNGLEITAAFLLAAGVLAVRVDHDTGVRSLTAILAVPLGILLLAWTRPLSWVWAALILALLLVPTAQRDGGSWIQRLPVRRLGTVAFAAAVLILTSAIVWFGYAIPLRASEADALTAPASWIALNPVERITLLLLRTGGIFSEVVGSFGWLDTPLPELAVFVWLSVGSVAFAIWLAGRNPVIPRWSAGAVLGLGYLAALLNEYTGAWGWQGRYLLPITAAVCVFAVPGLTTGLARLSALRPLVAPMMVALVTVNALAVVWFLFRNMYGVRSWEGRRLPSTPLPVGRPSWVPPLGGQGVVLVLVALAFACGVAAVWTFRTSGDDTDAPAEHVARVASG
jgi:Predicted membrane protein (DUF2142)